VYFHLWERWTLFQISINQIFNSYHLSSLWRKPSQVQVATHVQRSVAPTTFHTIYKNCESHTSWHRNYLCNKVTWWWVHKFSLQFRIVTLSFTIYIQKSHSTSDTSLDLFFKLRVEHKHLVGNWSQQLHVIHWDSSTFHYKFLLFLPIKLTLNVLRLNNVINAYEN
jgi:hypothetical protein